MMKRLSLLTVLAAGVSACSWVPISPEGEAVSVLTESQVANCDRLGQTTSKVPHKVGFLKRTESQQSEELAILARNEAANMGGNAVVAAEEPSEGRQRFIIYRCQ